MSKLLMLLYCLSLSFGLYAQGESDWWYFGSYAGLHFVEDTVDVVYDGAMVGLNTSSTGSDENGNLLFYSNGTQVYSNNHEIMENGGDISDTGGRSSLSISMDQNDSIYHLLYLNPWNELIYKTINIYANNGLGIVSEELIISDTAHLSVTATKKANGVDYWIVCRHLYGNKYITYSLTIDGLDIDNPIYSIAGRNIIQLNELGGGQLRINPQGNLLAFAYSGVTNLDYTGSCELFYFNNVNGEVGERILLMDDSNSNIQDEAYQFVASSTEFSHDGEKMYISGGWVYQCNIAILDSTSIIQSMFRYNNLIPSYPLYGLQLAKDGRIYIGNTGISWLSVIHHPNIAGLEAGFSYNGVDLSPNIAGAYLPNFDPSLFSSDFTVSNRCLFDETQFTLIYDLPYEYVFWEFGDGASSTEWEPTHVFGETGIYTVQLTTVLDQDTTMKEMEVIIEGYPSLDLGPDSSLFCEGDTLVLDAYNYASYYTWQDSSYQSSFEVTDEGKYYVEVKNICGQDSDTVKFVLDRDLVHLGTDTLICIEEPLLLLANQPSATSWLWQDGSTLPYYEAQQTGEYYVEVTTPCQFIYDSIFVDTKLCSLLPPNIITPNADGINDYFVVENLYEFGYTWSLEVFNRWGQQVYFSEDYQNNWKGENISDGVYFYVFSSSDTNRSYNGSLTILRSK